MQIPARPELVGGLLFILARLPDEKGTASKVSGRAEFEDAR